MKEENVEYRTKLKPSDVQPTNRLDDSEDKQNYYGRLAVANTLDWNGKWRDEKRLTEKKDAALLDSISSRLELTDYQKERAKHFRSQISNDFLGGRDKRATIITLCVCGLAGREDGRNYHPRNASPDEPVSKFGILLQELGISWQRGMSWWSKIRNEVDYDG